MGKFEPLPEFINGFRVIEDLGMVLGPKAKRPHRRCIYECKVCLKHSESAPYDLRKMASCFCNRDIPGVSLRLRNILKDMKKRCYNTNSIAYHRYAGRGITICDEWLDETNIFYAWALSNGYRDDLTVDRIDNSKGYSPLNCRFASYDEQMQNSRKATLTAKEVLEIRAIYPGLSYAKLAEKYGVNKSTIAYIINRKSWKNI